MPNNIFNLKLLIKLWNSANQEIILFFGIKPWVSVLKKGGENMDWELDYIRDIGIGHVANNYLRPISLLPKKN